MLSTALSPSRWRRLVGGMKGGTTRGVGEARAFKDRDIARRDGESLVLNGTFSNDMDLSITGSMEEKLDLTTLQPILTTRGCVVEARWRAVPGSHETRCNGASKE